MNVMLARFVDGGWEAPRKFLSVSDPMASEHAPVLSADENKMYFTRRFDPDGAEGGFVFPSRSSDVYFTYRTSKVEPFATPIRIDELARSDRGEQAMWLSPDQCRLYLQIVGPDPNGWDLYVAERTP